MDLTDNSFLKNRRWQDTNHFVKGESHLRKLVSIKSIFFVYSNVKLMKPASEINRTYKPRKHAICLYYAN